MYYNLPDTTQSVATFLLMLALHWKTLVEMIRVLILWASELEFHWTLGR